MCNEIARTILAQLGANRFIAMTGAKMFVAGTSYLMFKLPARFAKHGINCVRITLDPSDTYTVEWMNVRGMKCSNPVETSTGVYADSLRSLFASVTGLAVSL